MTPKFPLREIFAVHVFSFCSLLDVFECSSEKLGAFLYQLHRYWWSSIQESTYSVYYCTEMSYSTGYILPRRDFKGSFLIAS